MSILRICIRAAERLLVCVCGTVGLLMIYRDADSILERSLAIWFWIATFVYAEYGVLRDCVIRGVLRDGNFDAIANFLRSSSKSSRTKGCLFLAMIVGNRFGIVLEQSAGYWLRWLEAEGSRLIWESSIGRFMESANMTEKSDADLVTQSR